MFALRVSLIWFMIAANVVDFPDPVGPVTKTRPLCMSTMLNIAGGKLRFSIDEIVVSIFLKTNAGPVSVL